MLEMSKNTWGLEVAWLLQLRLQFFPRLTADDNDDDYNDNSNENID